MKLKSPVLVICISLLLYSCGNPSPRQYFEQAALNCNLLYGFAGYELERDLGYVQERLADEKTMKMKPVTRAEVVKEKLARVEENYQKVKKLGSNKDADEMLKASADLYEFVIPVYKNEYAALAALYDTNSPADKIAGAAKNITEKYAAKFEELYNRVIEKGTAFAERNGIPVKQVNPSPSN
jgi:hypothetical protein